MEFLVTVGFACVIVSSFVSMRSTNLRYMSPSKSFCCNFWANSCRDNFLIVYSLPSDRMTFSSSMYFWVFP